jgi:hypothetical protein
LRSDKADYLCALSPRELILRPLRKVGPSQDDALSAALRHHRAKALRAHSCTVDIQYPDRRPPEEDRRRVYGEGIHAAPLTESLAAPLIQATRRRYDEIARNNEEVAAREAAVQAQQARIGAEKAALEEQIAKRVREERDRIASEEGKKARMLLAHELELNKRSIAELQGVLEEREFKLANAQKAHADLPRKERELEDARRERALTIERKVSESVAAIREKAKQEAENASRLKIAERDFVLWYHFDLVFSDGLSVLAQHSAFTSAMIDG